MANSIIRWAERRAVQPPRVGAAYMAGQTEWPSWDTVKAISEGYKVSYVLYAVASDLADCVRSVPWQLKKVTNGGIEIVDNHPLVEMVRSPNTEGPWGALLEAVDLYKSLAGNAYLLWGQTSVDNIDVWSLRPDRVAIVPDAKGRIARYDYYIPGEAVPIPYKPEEILHFKFFDPGSDHYGMAPLQAAARLVDTSNAGLKWNWHAMSNRARPDLVMAPKEHLTPDQHEKLLELLTKRVAGTENARSVVIPSEPMELLQLSLSPVEMDFLQSFLTYEVGVCKIFHVHPEAIGTLGAKFENKEWALRAKWEGPVVTRESEMRAVFNHKFHVPFGTVDPKVARVGDIYLDYDLSQTPLADYQQGKAIDRAKNVWACGVPWNTAAQTFGVNMEPIEGGDVGYISVALLPVGSTSQAARSTRSINLETDSQKEFHWRTVDRKKQGWERGVASKASTLFREQGKSVSASVGSGTVDTDAAIDSFTNAWSKLITATTRAVIEDFGGKVIDDLTAGRPAGGRALPDSDIAFDPWSKSVQTWTEDHTAAAIDDIQKTSKVRIRKVVLTGIEAGRPIRDIANEIDDIFINWGASTDPAITTSRAFTIARTEVHAAASYGMHEAARQSGVVEEKAWLSSFDPPRARDDHMAISNQWIPFDEPYVMPDGVEMQHPGDGPAEHVVNCRCTETYRTRG